MIVPKLDFSLSDKMKHFPMMDPLNVQKITAQMLMGLRDIHSIGISHCDIKPDNLMFKMLGIGRYRL